MTRTEEGVPAIRAMSPVEIDVVSGALGQAIVGAIVAWGVGKVLDKLSKEPGPVETLKTRGCVMFCPPKLPT